MRRPTLAAAVTLVGLFAACGSDDGRPTMPPSDAGADACPPSSICGAGCCSVSELCSFGKCIAPGEVCADSSECRPEEYCEYVLGRLGEPRDLSDDGGCRGGATRPVGRCLPRPPICPPNAPPEARGVTCLEPCEVKPSATFAPKLLAAWGGEVVTPFSTDVMMTPIVIPLDDDNCDGVVSVLDIPEIVFTTFSGGVYTAAGTLRAISIVDGKVVDKWKTDPIINPGAQLAGGNIDGEPGNEVVACGVDGFVRAFRADGSVRWTSDKASGCFMPSIADLNGDGVVEVIVEGTVFDGRTGATRFTFPGAGSPIVSDIDDDGDLDIITSSQAFDSNGTLLVDTLVPGSWPAIFDLDGDSKPEVVAVDYAKHSASLWRYDPANANKFSWVRQDIDINAGLTQHCVPDSAGATTGGGPPTVADFDGDKIPDIALAGGIGYTVLSGAKIRSNAVDVVLWAVPTTDCSSAATGSSVFDFDGDGKAEVVYSDEQMLRIYEGPTGKVLFQTCNTTGTLEEYPLVADADGDGHADIIVVSNAYSAPPGFQCPDGTTAAQSGVRIFGDGDGTWVQTRRIWNEHAYHVTNIEEDGTVPTKELPNFKDPRLNNFRQNKAPGREFAAPDAIVSLRADCGDPIKLIATVTNVGQAALKGGTAVSFYLGMPGGGTLLGQGQTSRTLLSAQSDEVTLVLAPPPPGARDAATRYYATVDSGARLECRVDNNTSAPVACPSAAIR